jgi:hypothetical protein
VQQSACNLDPPHLAARQFAHLFPRAILQVDLLQRDLRTPPRDATPEKKGTSIVRGKITNADGRPLRRVQLRLSGETIPEGRTASTNGLGRFEITELPAGRYTLSANRAGYLSCRRSPAWQPGRADRLAGRRRSRRRLVLPVRRSSPATSSTRGEPPWSQRAHAADALLQRQKAADAVRGNAISDDTAHRLSGLEPRATCGRSPETWQRSEKQMLGFVPTFIPRPQPQSGGRVRPPGGPPSTWR